MNDSVDLVLMERFFAGECTPAERQRVSDWVSATPDGQRELDAYRLLCQQLGERRRHHRADPAAWRHMDERIAGDMAVARPTLRLRNPERRVHTNRRYLPLGLAAALCATGIAAVILVTGRLVMPIGVGGQIRDYTTASSARGTVTLRDGTRIMLGPATRLRIPADFGRTSRLVDLDGEAWLQVVHDKTRPLTIRTSRSVIQDIGTTFAVHAYADESIDRVVVQEGRVSLAACAMAGTRPCPSVISPTLLAAGDIGTVGPSGIAWSHRVDVSSYLAWMQGGLTFDHTVLRDAIREMDRAFDVEIVVADSSLLTQHITASFSAAPVNEVLDAVTFAVGAHYERVGRKVIIRRGAHVEEHPSTPHPTPSLSTVRASVPNPLDLFPQ